MRSLDVVIVLVVAPALAACLHDSSTAKPSSFEAQGRVDFRNFSAAFDAERVLGPNIDVSRHGDAWRGLVLGEIVDVNLHGAGIRGSGLVASWEETPAGVRVTAMCHGRLLRFEVNQDVVKIRTDTGGAPIGNAEGLATVGGSGLTAARAPTSYTLHRVSPDTFQGGFTFGGTAAELHPPEPQFALMMIGAFD